MIATGLALLIEARRLPCVTELALQDALSALFTELGLLKVRREHHLSALDRPDFLIDTCAVEVKIDGSPNAVTRQLLRYAQHVVVEELLLVTSRVTLTQTPLTLNAKPVRVAYVGGRFA